MRVSRLSEIQQFIDQIDEGMKKLQPCKVQKDQGNLTVWDIPYHFEGSELEVFLDEISDGGFNGCNVGLTGYHKNLLDINKLSILKKHFRLISVAHGTSLKRATSFQRYKEILQEDLRVANLFSEIGHINYDLYAGNIGNKALFSLPFQEAEEKNYQDLLDKYDLSPNSGYLELSKSIISSVAEVYKNQPYTIYFEIPGSKGRSMYPKIQSHTMLELVGIIDEYLGDKGKICIDIGHILSWSIDNSFLQDILETLTIISDKIGMLHISSAASYFSSFANIYDPKGKYMQRHSGGLDVQGGVCEQVMIDFIDSCRNILNKKNGRYIEVVESRPMYLIVKDYFPQLLSNINQTNDFKRFLNVIANTSKLLL